MEVIVLYLGEVDVLVAVATAGIAGESGTHV